MFLCLLSLLVMSLVEGLLICINLDEGHWSCIVVNILFGIALILLIIEIVDLRQGIADLRNGEGFLNGLFIGVSLLFSPMIISTTASMILLFISAINSKDKWKSIILSIVAILVNIIFYFLEDIIYNINTVWIYILIVMPLSVLSLIQTIRDY